MRPRKQTYSLDRYLKKNLNGEIDNNADVQRNFAWKNEQINELIVTVLTDDYIPPIILGEEKDTKLHIVDGGCRTVALIKFRKMNYKITSSIENSLIPFKKKIIDENGKVTYVDDMFDIKNKTFDKLPEELKEKFDDYQIETVIHECCDSFKISKYIKRYNNHVAMNIDQKAFTYIDRFAGCIRKIMNSKFFVECNDYSDNDKGKGVIERVILETIMCANHFDNWKKEVKAISKYLNENAKEEEFITLSENLHRLEAIITDDIKDIFNKKDSFIFLTLFDKFTKLGIYDDMKFAEFLKEFKSNLRNNNVNDKGLLFDQIKRSSSTKDKSVVMDKLDMLEKFMMEFLQIDTKWNQVSDEEFISEVLNMDIDTFVDDIDFYNDTLDELEEKSIKDGSKLLEKENRKSLLAMVVYSYKEDVDLDEWIADYAANTNIYCVDQKYSYLHMKNNFEKYCRAHKKSA